MKEEFVVVEEGEDDEGRMKPPPPPTTKMDGADASSHRKRMKLFPSLLIAAVVFLALMCLYYGSFFAPGRDDDDELFRHRSFSNATALRSFSFKSIPVCHQNHSEPIPCLDRQLIFHMKLKLNLSLMEHYERHCPPPHRRFNCLIPPPPGYKIPVQWPASRDEVWKANIPHTHLADEKSDKNWMVVRGDKIKFPGGGTQIRCSSSRERSSTMEGA